MTEDEFVAIVTEGQPSAPGYFSYDAVLNRSDHDVFDAEATPVPLTIGEVLDRQAAGAVVL
ncbi:MAG: MBL fold metallo-hydrolase, partial [Solirubrobacteraceae bacterium]